MKQVLQNLRDGKTMVRDVPIPSVRPGMALVRTAASIVSSGTERMVVEFAGKNLAAKARSRPDLVKQVIGKARREGIIPTIEAALNRLDQPLPLGYSSAGTIISVGENMAGFQPGDRVACAGGNYAVHAEYALVPKNLLTLLPRHVDFESAAFVTLGSIALHGFRLSNPQVGCSVLVIGLGLVGLLSCEIAIAAGCRVFGVDINTDRLEFARQSGIAVSDTENAVQSGQGFSRGRGFDVVLICADTPANDPVELAGQMVRDRGHVIVVGAVGLTLPRKLYFDKEVHFQVSRSYGPGRYDPQYEENGQDYPAGYVRWTEGRNLEAFVDLLANDQINTRRLITHRFPIDEAAQAYDLITGKKKEDFTAVLLTYPSTSDSSDSIRIFEKPAMSQTANAGEAHRMGVLGSGNYATVVFLPNLKRMKSVRMAGIASGSGATASHAARKFGFQYSTADELEIINDESTSMVAILTRHQHHARQIITSLKAGKHVFCEKPMAISVEECENVILEANKAGSSCLMVGFNRRFAPLVLKLINFLEDRSEPLFMQYRVNAGFLPATHWLHDPAQGGGRLIGEACHFIDLMTFITGSIPKTVHGTSIPDIGRYQQDNFSLSITFQDGSLGILNYLANGDKSYPKEYLEVFGGGDIAILDDYRSLSLVKNGLKKVHQLKLHQDKGHTRALETFIAAVKQPGRPPITYEELWAVAQASFCAVESLNSNVPVNIPPYPIMHYST